MNNDILTVYGAFSTSDEFGRLSTCHGYYSKRSHAVEAARGKGWYGGDGSVIEAKVIKHDGKMYLLEDVNPIIVDGTKLAEKLRIKDRVLSKLSDEEKESLDLLPKQKGNKNV